MNILNRDVVCNMIGEALQAYDLRNQHMGVRGKTLIRNLINSRHINCNDLRKLVEDGLRRFDEQTMIDYKQSANEWCQGSKAQEVTKGYGQRDIN